MPPPRQQQEKKMGRGDLLQWTRSSKVLPKSSLSTQEEQGQGKERKAKIGGGRDLQ